MIDRRLLIAAAILAALALATTYTLNDGGQMGRHGIKPPPK